MKKQTEMVKKMLPLFALAIFGVILIGCSSASDTANKANGVEDKNKTDVVAAIDLLKEYEKSKQDTKRKYDGKEIVVRGYSFAPPQMPKGNEWAGGGSVTVGEKNYTVEDINCYFDKADAASFEKIKGDQYIVVQGVFDGEMFPKMKPCRLVKVE